LIIKKVSSIWRTILLKKDLFQKDFSNYKINIILIESLEMSVNDVTKNKLFYKNKLDQIKTFDFSLLLTYTSFNNILVNIKIT
jgi:hypothetical protein